MTITQSTAGNNVASGTAGGIWDDVGSPPYEPTAIVVVDQSAVIENTAQTNGEIDSMTFRKVVTRIISPPHTDYR